MIYYAPIQGGIFILKNVVDRIIQLNILVFICWMLLNTQFMMDNFLVSSSHVASGKIWTLVTSVFSHNMLFHLLINMFVLSGFGNIMEQVLGSKQFLTFYLVAGIGGSLGHCLTSSLMLHEPNLPAIGASGAISGVLVIFSIMYPRQLVFIFGLIPLPAVVATSLFVGSDLWGLMAQTGGYRIPIGYGAHLGGALTGFLYYFLFLNQRSKINLRKMRIHSRVRNG